MKPIITNAPKYVGRFFDPNITCFAVGIILEGRMLSSICQLKIENGVIVSAEMLNAPDTSSVTVATGHRALWKMCGVENRG